MLQNRKRMVSRQHARISSMDGVYHLIDIGSKNTTLLNDARLEEGHTYPLQHGDRIIIGDFEVEFLVKERPLFLNSHLLANPGLPDGTRSVRLFWSKHHAASSRSGQPLFGQHGVSLTYSISELFMLSDLAFEMGASSTQKHRADVLLRRVLEVTDAEQGVLNTMDRYELDLEHRQIRANVTKPGAFSLNKKAVRWLQRHQSPLRLCHRKEIQKMTGCKQISSLLCTPLLRRGRLAGLLSVFNKMDRRGFTEADEKLLILIAMQFVHLMEHHR